jgi:hypothetical protein
MIENRPVLFRLAFLCALGVSVSAPVRTWAQSDDPAVTSDSPEYCDTLMERITGMTRNAALTPSTEVALLSEEGERMCVHGQIRAGIMRLRRAIALLRHGE